MKADKTQTRHLTWALLAGALPLLLVVGLSLLLSHVQALAQPAADLDVTKEVNKTVAAPGETLAYTVTIQDNRSAGGRLWLTDTLPPELDCVSLDASVGDFGVENDVITWTSDMYGNGYTAYIYLSAEISPDIAFAAIDSVRQFDAAYEICCQQVARAAGLYRRIAGPAQQQREPADLEIGTGADQQIGASHRRDQTRLRFQPVRILVCRGGRCDLRRVAG